MTHRVVLVRHGESEWNKANLFTGWTDVDLSEKGLQEAADAGKKLKEAGFCFEYAYTSFLKRAIKTLHIVLEEMDLLWIPEEKSWRLNEKHYGALQGFNKAEMTAKYGAEQIKLWRRSYDVRPESLTDDDERNPANDIRYKNIDDPQAKPHTEALVDTINRIVPYWESVIFPKAKECRDIIVAAHGNSLRGIIKYLKNISEEDIVNLNLPTGVPYVFEFDENMKLQKDYFLADPETLKKLMDAVANQGNKK